MSYIGKILVVMQLVLSICLMAFAAAVSTYQTNWKQKSEQTQAQLTKLQTDKNQADQEAKAAADKLIADMKVEQDKRATEEAKVVQANLEITNLRAQVKQLGEESAQRAQIGSDLADDSIARQNEVKLVRQNYKLALEDRDKEYKAKAALEDKIFEQTTKIERLTGQNKLLLVDNQNYRDVLNKFGLPLEIEEYQKAKTQPPKIYGEVLEVKKPKEGSQLFEISLGENDGLIVGNKIYVYRGGDSPKYLGQAEVRLVQADKAVCAMLPRSNLVEKGDHVATNLN